MYNDAMIQYMTSLIAAAMTCGGWRVVSFQFGYLGGKWGFGPQTDGQGSTWLCPASTGDATAGDVSTNHHDGIAHHDGADDMSTMVATHVTWINEYYARTIGKVAMQLLATQDVDGRTMLDNTLLIWGNELGRGDHNMDNAPIIHMGLGQQKGGGRVIDYGVAKGGTAGTSGGGVAGTPGSQVPANYHGYHALTTLGHKVTESQWSPTGLAPGPYTGY
jgi:hypothetical protein